MSARRRAFSVMRAPSVVGSPIKGRGARASIARGVTGGLTGLRGGAPSPIRPAGSRLTTRRTPHAPVGTRPGRDAPRERRAARRAPRRGLVPDRGGRHAGAVHGLGRGSPAVVPQGHGARLGDGRVRDAAARHPHARAARAPGRLGAHAGDPAPDRAQLARGRGPRRAGRAPDHGRLRRDPGRRRHALRGHHRRLGRAEARRLAADGRRRRDVGPDHGPRGGGVVRDLRGPGGARPRLPRGLRGGGGRQLRPHRRGGG